MNHEIEDVVQEIAIIRLKFVDVPGRIYTLSITPSVFEKAREEGIGFDSSSIPRFGSIFRSDMRLKPDLASLKIVNGERTEGWLMCDIVHPDGKPYKKCTRSLLKTALAEEDAAYTLKPELEFFLTQGGDPIDEDSYLTTADTLGHRILDDLVVVLEREGISVEKFHHENGRGQYELEFLPTAALRVADSILFCRETLKRLCTQYGVEVSFLPKPFENEAGSGMHVHQELRKNGKNLFYNGKLTDRGKRFIAGQLYHIRGLTRVTNPVKNSYKRFGEQEAPKYVCWGHSNRSALIRVPPSGRIEIRSPDPTCNPYLAFFFLLKAGLSGDGTLPNPVKDNVYEYDEAAREKNGVTSLPMSLQEAEKAFMDDPLFNEYAYLFE